MPRGHTVPNLIRQRRRLIRIIQRQSILIRAQAARIEALKGTPLMRCHGPKTPEQVLLESIQQMQRECELLQGELAERNQGLGSAQARLQELTLENAQLRNELLRTSERKKISND